MTKRRRQSKKESFEQLYCLSPLAIEWYDKLCDDEQSAVSDFIKSYLPNPEDPCRGRIDFNLHKHLSENEKGAAYTILNCHDATLAARDYVEIYPDHKLDSRYYNLMGFLANFDIGSNEFVQSSDGTYSILHSRLTSDRRGVHPFTGNNGTRNFMIALNDKLAADVAQIAVGEKLALEIADEICYGYGVIGRSYTIEKFIRHYVDGCGSLKRKNKGTYRVMLSLLDKKDIKGSFLQLIEDEGIKEIVRKINDGEILKSELEEEITKYLDLL